jgi:UDP-N-acetylglucosamine--N-acetylmuramyl-(pentapeptide) pyrophosphoryl-undecaprenol N-acetylglucosamine transferase
VGVGGYASGPLLRAAAWKKVPIVIQEQNSYPGITNKLLGKAASAICVAYDGMEKFFPSNKLKHTGNPVRSGFNGLDALKNEAHDFFGLGRSKHTVLAIGGSLGARTINESLAGMLDLFPGDGDTQLIWQTGKSGVNISEAALKGDEAVKAMPFISRMDLAYAAADVIISRAGAMSISELCLVGKPVILIPSPNVAEDHQTKNAMALVNKGAAVLVKDSAARNELRSALEALIKDTQKQTELSKAIKELGLPNAADTIAKEVLSQMRKG